MGAVDNSILILSSEAVFAWTLRGIKGVWAAWAARGTSKLDNVSGTILGLPEQASIIGGNAAQGLSSKLFSKGLQKIASRLDKKTLKQIDHLLDQVNKGNLNPGIGNNVIKSGNNVIFREFRHRGGARVYFQNTERGIEILGYSNKANQQKVINLIKHQHGF